MERNIRHVQRWLERCMEAYRQKRGGAALAELESARAELEVARNVLADELAGQERSVGLPMGRCARIALTSIVLLFSFALPTAHRLDQAVPPLAAGDGPSFLSVEMVTEEERLLLQNLRKPPAVAQVPPSDPLPEATDVPRLTAHAVNESVAVTPGKETGKMFPEQIENEVSEPGPAVPDSDKLDHGVPGPSVEEFLSLLQAGQRALQSPQKGIPIQP